MEAWRVALPLPLVSREQREKAADVEQERLQSLVSGALAGLDDGELFIEISKDEAFVFDDGKLKNASFDVGQGFGLRGVSGESVAYAHSSILSEEAVKKAAETVEAIRHGGQVNMSAGPVAASRKLYTPDSPLESVSFREKVKLLQDIDAYLRNLNWNAIGTRFAQLGSPAGNLVTLA